MWQERYILVNFMAMLKRSLQSIWQAAGVDVNVPEQVDKGINACTITMSELVTKSDEVGWTHRLRFYRHTNLESSFRYCLRDFVAEFFYLPSEIPEWTSRIQTKELRNQSYRLYECC